MKIVSLTASNVKRLVAVQITPDGNLVQITGRNGAGKTSVLDCIWWAMAGAKHIQAVPIRKGEDKAVIKLDLGELIVTRTFRNVGPDKDKQVTTLVVESADGARFPSPQRVLDDLIGALAFDPLEFVGMKPAEQLEELRNCVELEIDIDALDGKNARDFEQRREINREVKAKRAQAEAIGVADGLPEKMIDTSALLTEMTNAGSTNAAIEQERSRRERMASDVDDQRTKLEFYRDKVEALQKEVAVAMSDSQLAEESLGRMVEDLGKLATENPLAEHVDIEAIRIKFDDAEKVNRLIDDREGYHAVVARAEALEEKAAIYTEIMAKRTIEKEHALAAVEMPVEGLSFGDGAVLYDGIPFDQAESSAQLKVSAAIAMAMNPKLRVLRIKEGSLLDDGSLAQLAGMADADDYQIWCERVDSTGMVGFTIEDGELAAIDGEAPPEPEPEPDTTAKSHRATEQAQDARQDAMFDDPEDAQKDDPDE